MMKIADFGLARDIHHIDYYKKTTNVSADKATRCMSSAQDSAGQVFSHLDFSAVTQYRLLCLRNSVVGCAEYAHSFPSPALHVPSLPLCCPAWGHPQCPVLLAGPTACEVDGTRGIVRPDLHPPE